MAITGTVRHDLAGLEARLRLYPQELLAADVRAKNRTASSTRTEAVRRLRPLLRGLKAGAIRRQIKLKRASRAAPRAVLEFSAKRFRLFGNYNARQTKSGVRITGLPWRMEALDGDLIPVQALAHAFIQRARATGVPNVWLRVGTKRYPITAIVASSLATAFRNADLGAALVTFSRARHRAVLGQEMRYRLSRRKAT